jgi:N-methylhydantoinase B
VRADIAKDLVSVAGARRYGVVIDDSGQVDVAATNSLRESLRAERGEPEFFDFGGKLEDIISRCKEETHLDPPVPPSFAGVPD